MVALAVVALGIEFAQYIPESFPGGHATGEFLRNLAYALIGAVLFNWIVVELPALRRRRVVYGHHHTALQFLVILGPVYLAEYRGIAHQVRAEHEDPDGWDRNSVKLTVESIRKVNPGYFGEGRRQQLALAIRGAQEALDGLDSASSFLDADVAVALALFPAQRGLSQLQPPTPGSPEPWTRDLHIVWELVEASRRLYVSLQGHAPWLDLQPEGASSTLSDGSTWHVQLKDLQQ